MRFVINVLLILSISINLQAQSIDSLKIELEKSKDKIKQIELLIEIAKISKRLQPDLAMEYGKKAIIASKKAKYLKGEAQSYFQLGSIYRTKQMPDSALVFYNQSIQIWIQLHDTTEICKSLTHIGNMYADLGQFNQSIEYQEKCLKLSSTANIKKQMGMSLYNLGNAYKKIGASKKALDYYLKAKDIFGDLNEDKGLASCLNSIGVLYQDWLDYEKALNVYKEGLKLEEKKNNQQGIIGLKINIGNTYIKLAKYNNAIKTYREALLISESINDFDQQALSLLNLGLTYTDLYDFKQANFHLTKMRVIIPKVNEQYIIALIYQGIGYSLNCQSNCKEALMNLEKSIKIAEEQHLDDIQPTNYLFISQAYMCMGDGVKASEYYKKHERTRDQSNKTLNDSRVEFETAQQEKEIHLLNKQQEVNQKLIKAKEIETKQQRLIIYIFIVGLLFIIVFLIIVINQYRQKKKANIKLGEQKLLLEDQKRNIDDSINYAQRIQEAVLSLNDTTGTILDKSFVLFRPKSVVSGDFYWATIVNEWAIIAVADCTGHGVPGAFMSMLGVSFLSEIVRKSEINQANQVLGELREYIIDALKQQGRIGEQKDGMDIALCAINIKTLECQYSGANNPLYVFKKSSLNLIEIKPDKMPVAIYDKMDDFTNHTIQLEKGDRLYLFSDGYADQFGGAKGKKFMKKSLKELIFKTTCLEIDKQCHELESELDKWMLFADTTTGLSHEQIDDITLLGVEI